jgi:hypothetical protein
VIYEDAAIHCGDIRGGTIYGGIIRGGTIHGGVIYGGTIYGGTIYGGATHGGTIHGGAIYGGTVPYSWAARWEASISSPGHVSIGCQTHSIADWLREDAGSPVPWDEHCTDAERTIIVGVIRMLQMQMDAGVCDWRNEL